MGNYEKISKTNDVNLIKDIKDLICYKNFYGITDELKEFLNLSEEEINLACEKCLKYHSIKELRKNFQKLIKEGETYAGTQESALDKNEHLSYIMKGKRKVMANLGTRGIKLLLNSLADKGDYKARLYRIALEAEDENVKAKENFYYRDSHYFHKEELLKQLLTLCFEHKIKCGKAKSNVAITKYILYFELPDCEQISFHTNMNDNIINIVPIYDKDWDGKVNSTLDKLEDAIFFNYKDLIEKKIEEKEKRLSKKKNS